MTLPGLARPSGSNAQRSFWKASRSASPNILRHVALLVDADAVLAGDRAAGLDARDDDLAGQLLGALGLALGVAVVADERVQVAVAGVEDVGHAQAVLARELVDAVEHLAERACAG